MSIYSYLFCDDCKEYIWVADPDQKYFHADGDELFAFLEKHRHHKLAYDWEEGKRETTHHKFKNKSENFLTPNPDSKDVDFRVESNYDKNAFPSYPSKDKPKPKQPEKEAFVEHIGSWLDAEDKADQLKNALKKESCINCGHGNFVRVPQGFDPCECKRFPKTEEKNIGDWCGEWKEK